MKFVIVLVALCAAVLPTIALPTPVSQRNRGNPPFILVSLRPDEIVEDVVDDVVDLISVGKTKLHL
jgi:hypothetical protein